jgi:hypothetical protein
MRTRFFTLAIAALAIGFAALVGTADAAFDKAELKCRKAVAKGFLKAITTADKTSQGCHKGRDKDAAQIGTDCNDLGPTPGMPGAADAKGKFAKAQQKLIDTPAKKCAGLDTDIADLFISCPEPCATEISSPNPLSTMDDAVACLACYAGDVADTKNATNLDSPDPALLSGDDIKCRGAIAKGYGKYLATIVKTRTKCQDGADKNGSMELDNRCQTSENPDGKGKIEKALEKAEDGVDKSCAAANLTTLGSCATTNLVDLKTCLADAVDLADVDGFPAHYQLDATVCPTGLTTTIAAGNGIAGPTVSRLDIGWKGLGHNFDVPDAYSVVVDVSCAAVEPPCGECITTGVNQSHPNSQRFMRCTNDFSVMCDEPFTNDADDCGGSFCTYILGPPVPISAGGNPSCSINALAADVSGTGNVETGVGAAETNLATKVFTGGSSSLTQPCPLCVGDTTPNDGIQDGLCDEGSRDGLACDTNGYDATFANLDNGVGLSLDCVPTSLENITGTGLKISFELTTGASSLGAEVACDSPLGSFDCFCGQCTGDTLLPCVNNADCAAAAAGTCTANTGGVGRQPNDCNNFNNCADIGDEKGECSDKTDKWCEGFLKANGRGFLGCLSNAECINPSFPCPGGDCGPCMLEQPRPCFLDPIETQGVSSTEDPVLAGTFCVPPTLNPAINSASGLVGPGRVVVQQSIDRSYD